MTDLISREKLKDDIAVLLERNGKLIDEWLANCIDDIIDEQPTIETEPRWVPVTERLPERDKAVLITWVNHKPMSYYADIKDAPFTAVAVWHGIWYWWSVVCEDFLLEYGRNEADEIDKDVEVIAWMPLPEPYREVEKWKS